VASGACPAERAKLAVAVSYVRSIRPIDVERVHEELAAGPEGLGVTMEGRAPVVLLPSVGRDERAGPRELLGILKKKCGLSDWGAAKVFAIRTQDIVVRPRDAQTVAQSASPRDEAASFLARLVDREGAISFAIDARGRRLLSTGKMHHGRAASVVRALRQHGGHRRVADRASNWLAEQIRKGAAGGHVEGWPEDTAMRAGSLALAQMAGVDVRQELQDAARAEDLGRSPWHAAQVVAALGREAPEPLWRACVDHLASQPWAPWTLVAARARGDGGVIAAAAPDLAASIRLDGPYRGGCRAAEVPETAVTALVVEALDGLPDADAREAVARGRAFLAGLQLLGDSIPPALDAELACGGFAASPVVVDLLRCDVAGHAFSALGDSTWTQRAVEKKRVGQRPRRDGRKHT
jgi:hypothetical protein